MTASTAPSYAHEAAPMPQGAVPAGGAAYATWRAHVARAVALWHAAQAPDGGWAVEPMVHEWRAATVWGALIYGAGDSDHLAAEVADLSADPVHISPALWDLADAAGIDPDRIRPWPRPHAPVGPRPRDGDARGARRVIARRVGAQRGLSWAIREIAPGTPYPDEPGEEVPPGWWLLGTDPDRPGRGPAVALLVDAVHGSGRHAEEDSSAGVAHALLWLASGRRAVHCLLAGAFLGTLFASTILEIGRIIH